MYIAAAKGFLRGSASIIDYIVYVTYMLANKRSTSFTVNDPYVEKDTIAKQLFYLRPMFREDDPLVCIMARIYIIIYL